VSKATSDETMGVFMRNSTFKVCSTSDNNNFLRKLIDEVRDGALHVRELVFDDFDLSPDVLYDLPVNSDLELAVHCKALHTIP
jgi:hypothetical protein